MPDIDYESEINSLIPYAEFDANCKVPKDENGDKNAWRWAWRWNLAFHRSLDTMAMAKGLRTQSWQDVD